MWRVCCLIACVSWILTHTPAVAQDDDEKARVVILLAPQLKGFKDKIYPSIPNLRPLKGDRADESYKARVAVGTLDALKKDADVKFIAYLQKYAFVPPQGFGGQPSNQVGYSLYYRDDPKKAPVLLASHTLNLGGQNPKTEDPWEHFGTKFDGSMADGLAAKIIDGKPLLYPGKSQFAPLDPIKRVAFLAKKEEAGDKVIGKIAIKNRLPVKVRIEQLDYITEDMLTGRNQGEPDAFVTFKEPQVIAPNETKTVTWDATKLFVSHVRLRWVVVGEP